MVKVGGSILSSARDYVYSASMIAKLVESNLRPTIVVSAARNATDLILRACDGDRRALDKLSSLYLGVAEELGGRVVGVVEDQVLTLRRILENCSYRCDAKVRDYASSFGEVISKILLSSTLEELGVRIMMLNALDLIVTDGVYGNASIDYDVTKLNLSKVVSYAREMGVAVVIEGFIGRGRDGAVTTLGRGGSDYTAVAIASLLGIPEVWLVTDVPGILSIDPSISPKAKLVPSLDYREAFEASLHGVKRINPKSFEPVILGLGRPRVFVRSWDSRGTLISDSSVEGPKLVTVSSREPDTVLVIGRGVGGKSFVAKLLEVVDEDYVAELIVSSVSPSLRIRAREGKALELARVIHDELLG